MIFILISCNILHISKDVMCMGHIPKHNITCWSRSRLSDTERMTHLMWCVCASHPHPQKIGCRFDQIMKTTKQITGWWLSHTSSSLGMIIPNIWKVIKFHGSKPPSRSCCLQWRLLSHDILKDIPLDFPITATTPRSWWSRSLRMKPRHDQDAAELGDDLHNGSTHIWWYYVLYI